MIAYSIRPSMPIQRNFKRQLQVFQANRLRHDHADLAAEAQYRKVAKFFFEEIYGPRDFSHRDAQARRLHQFVHLAPGLMVRDVEQVLELLELTDQLDDAVATCMQQTDAPFDFDERCYEQAYRLVDSYDLRLRQLDLIRNSLYNVHRLSRNQLMGIALHQTTLLAQAVGMADIHRFLRIGYDSIQPVRDIHRFVETVYTREIDRLDRIYAVKTA